MILYFAHGQRDYGPRPLPVYRRSRWEFQCVLSGSIAPRGPRMDQTPRAGRLWVFGPDCWHGWGGGDSPAEIAVWHFPAVSGALRRRVGPHGMAEVTLSRGDRARLAYFAQQTAAHYPRETVRTPAIADAVLAYLTMLLSGLSTRRVGPGSASTPALSQPKAIVARATAWFQEHLHEGPSVTEVAEALAMSEAHLRRQFHAAGKPSPHRVFSMLRVQEAEHLIRTTDFKLAEIAHRLGYSGPEAFSRTFRRVRGVSPGALRPQ